ADRPATRPLAVEAELRDEPVEAAQHLAARVAELARADDRRDPELSLPGERLRVDRQPRLALGGQNVVAVQVLVQEHLLTLCSRQFPQGLERGVEQPPLERTGEPPPGLLERIRPPGR